MILFSFLLACLALEVVGIVLLAVPGTRGKMTSLLNAGWLKQFAPPLIRIGFAVMFLMAAWPKLMSPYGFAELVAQYQFLPSWSVNFFSLWLPVMELLMALGYLFTRWVREWTVMYIIVMTMFIIALTQALARDLGITCGCFDIVGAEDKLGAWTSLVRDLVLVPPLIWMYLKETNRYLWQFKRPSS